MFQTIKIIGFATGRLYKYWEKTKNIMAVLCKNFDFKALSLNVETKDPFV